MQVNAKGEQVVEINNTGNPIPVSLSGSTGDINVDTTAISTSGLIGKPSGGDFTTAYASATTITLGVYPDGTAPTADDIVTIVQIATGGAVTATYSRDDKTMSISGATLTVTGASFAASDSFVIYTNVPRKAEIIYDTPESFEDTSFVTGDSPATLDINAALGRNASEVSITNDGAGNFTFAVSNNGASFGDEITMKAGETYNLSGVSVDTIRITWVADSAYRVVAI